MLGWRVEYESVMRCVGGKIAWLPQYSSREKQTRNPIFEIYSITTLLIAFKAHHNYCALLELSLPSD